MVKSHVTVVENPIAQLIPMQDIIQSSDKLGNKVGAALLWILMKAFHRRVEGRRQMLV
jgi:hypothetical protein